MECAHTPNWTSMSYTRSRRCWWTIVDTESSHSRSSRVSSMSAPAYAQRTARSNACERTARISFFVLCLCSLLSQGDRASKHVYGSMNHGEQIESKPEFHAHMLKAAEKLHIQPHSVIDGKGQAVELAT